MPNSAPLAADRTLVWDAFVRVFHWSLVLLVVSLVVTAHLGIQDIHMTLGVDLTVLGVARVVWGYVGPEHARFASFVPTPAAGLRYLGAVLRGHPPRHLGHNPAGGLMVVALLATVLTLALTGLVLQATVEFEGLLVEILRPLDDATVHQVFAVHRVAVQALYLLVPLHLLGVVLASVQHRENLVWSMFTGFKSTTTAR